MSCSIFPKWSLQPQQLELRHTIFKLLFIVQEHVETFIKDKALGMCLDEWRHNEWWCLYCEQFVLETQRTCWENLVSPRNTLGSLRWGTVFMSCQLASPAFPTSTSPSQCGEIAGIASNRGTRGWVPKNHDHSREKPGEHRWVHLPPPCSKGSPELYL